ncbi:MAG: MOSC domain-containing protein [Propionibacteriales bacterium]|nr:MOSC domain-containing protein [Propionibacteriales bacterium]
MQVGTITALWRYPVKSMGGESVPSSYVDERALHADRMWAVRDLELNAVTTARRLPALLGCTARYVAEPPAGVGPGDVVPVVVTFPDGTEVESTDSATMDARLSDLTGKRVTLVPLPPLSDKAAYRGVLASKKDIRQQFGLADDEPLPDYSMFSLRMLAELAIYATPIGIFADAYPLHIVTTSSLRTMAAHGGDFDVRRFRPNIVIDCPMDGLAEQEWIGGTLHVGDLSTRVEVPTIRCTVPLREQVGVPADPEVMRSVSTYGQRWFGVYADVAAPGTLRVGDTVDLEPPPSHGAVATSVSRMAERVKRNAVKTGNRFLPR